MPLSLSALKWIKVQILVERLDCTSDFAISRSCVPDTKKFSKIQNNLWYASQRMQRSIDRSDHVFVEYSVCVISVAVLVAVV